MDNVVAQIEHFNLGRDPKRLELKYKALRKDAFSFFRGTCHLFWSEAPSSFWSSDAPLAWTCGDLHLENFGCFKAEDGLVHFDVNDFDEAIAAPCYSDLVRLMSSIIVAAGKMGLDDYGARALCARLATSYAESLRGGKPQSIGRATAAGPIADLMEGASRRTEMRNGRRQLRTDGKKALPVDGRQRAALQKFMEEFASRQDDPEFFKMIDGARRISGTGSLGVERYVLLIEGKGSPNRNSLLDLKEARPSVLVPYTGLQRTWKSEADRIVCVQRRMQAASPVFLHNVVINGTPFVLRNLQPSEDRFDLSAVRANRADLQLLVATMGKILAWGQLRSSGWQGAANTGELIAFGRAVGAWQAALIELAETFARRVEADWRAFRTNSH